MERNVRPSVSALRVYRWPIWGLALLPLSGALGVAGAAIAWFNFIDASRSGVPSAISSAGDLLAFWTGPLGLVGICGTAWLAGLGLARVDAQQLKRAGVAEPFGWGWAALLPVYLIGRTRVARRATEGNGAAVVWVLVASYALTVGVYVGWVWCTVLRHFAFSWGAYSDRGNLYKLRRVGQGRCCVGRAPLGVDPAAIGRSLAPVH